MTRTLAIALLAAFAVRLNAQRPIALHTVHDFGGLNDDPAIELTRIGSIVAVSAGRFVVSNARPLEVRLYDATGKVLARFGRSGNGPGEFALSASVYPWSGDSILTLSNGTRRWMLFRLDGTLVREWPVDSLHPTPGGLRITDWALLRHGYTGSRGCLTPGVSRIAAPKPWFPRLTLLDGVGRIWVDDSANKWRVHAPDGQALGVVTLPAGFEIRSFSGDQVVGSREDAEGGLHVTAVRLDLPVGRAPISVCEMSPPASAQVTIMKQTMSALRTAGETVWSERKSYPTSIPTQYVTLPPGLEGTVIPAPPTGWAVRLTDRTTRLQCFMQIGTTAWYDGSITCGN